MSLVKFLGFLVFGPFIAGLKAKKGEAHRQENEKALRAPCHCCQKKWTLQHA